MAKSSVDLVVGIDFGMTCTGVAFSKTRMALPRIIQGWPGKPGESHNKVPSTIFYSPANPFVKDWGFLCQHTDGKKEWFKPYLDPERLQSIASMEQGQFNSQDLPAFSEVRKWFKDYMVCLYKHISTIIQSRTGRWGAKRIEFVFSLPCTFNKLSIPRDIRDLVVEAGFEVGGAQHKVDIGLTEPEAAAVYTLKDTAIAYQLGEIVLVCDAGGGTTDLAFLEIVGSQNGQMELQELTVVEGQNVGSTNIDIAFEKMVEERLKFVHPKLDEQTAWSMMHGAEYIAWKCNFGELDSIGLGTFAVTVPTVGIDFNCESARIRNGKMRFSQKDFRDLFDPEVEKIITLIHGQIDSLEAKYADKDIKYIILSGGLGSSAYLRTRLQSAFVSTESHPDLQILVSEEPQLAVVKGLVIDRIQKLRSGRAVLNSRICRASYAISIDMPYNPKEHQGQEVYKDYDGEVLVREQLQWMIRKVYNLRHFEAFKRADQIKGEAIDPGKPLETGARRNFVADEIPNIGIAIYMSYNDPTNLPTYAAHADAQYVCRINFDLSQLPLDNFELKERPGKAGLKSKNRQYYSARYTIKVIVGAADLTFKVRHKGILYRGKVVTVEWQ